MIACNMRFIKRLNRLLFLTAMLFKGRYGALKRAFIKREIVMSRKITFKIHLAFFNFQKSSMKPSFFRNLFRESKRSIITTHLSHV